MADTTDELLDLETNDAARSTKRQKTEKTPPIEDDETAIKPADLDKLKEFFGKFGEDVDKYSATVAEAGAEAYKEYIPARVMSKIKLKHTDVLKKKSNIEKMLVSGKSRYSASGVRKMMCEIKKLRRRNTMSLNVE